MAEQIPLFHTPGTLPVSLQPYLFNIQLEIQTPVPSLGVDKYSESLVLYTKLKKTTVSQNIMFLNVLDLSLFYTIFNPSLAAKTLV